MNNVPKLKINIPTVPTDSFEEYVSKNNIIIKQLGNYIENSFELLCEENKLKSYKRENFRYSQWPYYQNPKQYSLSIWDYKFKDIINIETFSYTLKIPLDSPLSLLTPDNININVNDPWDIEFHKSKIKNLKTQNNLTIIFSIMLKVNNKPKKEDFYPNKKCKHEFELLYHAPVTWLLIWTCSKCGLTGYCSCFKEAIEGMKEGKLFYNLSPDNISYKWRNGTPITYTNKTFINNEIIEYKWRDKRDDKIYKEKHFLLEDMELSYDTLGYIDNACEVCRNKPSSHRYTSKMYARSEFEIKYNAYVKKKLYELKLTGKYNDVTDDILERKANNIVREELGFKKIGEGFVTETELYRLIKSLYPNNKVIHHYRTKWLKGQEIDIFIPELKVAIEYDGIQHFKAIKHWGGEKALKENKRRDELKNKKCLENDITLIRFNYKEEEFLSEEYVKNKINKKLKEK